MTTEQAVVPPDSPEESAPDTSSSEPDSIRTVFEHLAVGCIALSVTGAIGAVTTTLRSETHAGSTAAGFLLGTAIVLFFFSSASFVVAWADIVQRKLIFPLGIAAYLTNLTLVGLVVFAIADSGWSGFSGFLWGIIVGTAMWMVAQVIWAFARAK